MFRGSPRRFQGMRVYIREISRSVELRGAHEGGGRAQGGRRVSLHRGLLASFLTSTPSPLDCVCSKNNSPEGFIPSPFDILFSQGPVQIAVFLPISVFRKKGISNGIQTERNLREDLFWNKRNPGDLEWTLRKKRGGHEGGGRPPYWAHPCLVGPSSTSQPTSFAYISLRILKTSNIKIDQEFHCRKPL